MNKAIGAKIAFLGLLVFGLLGARLIVALRSGVALSEPITLSHAGLSISMPFGTGWEHGKRWAYKENCFTLGSTYITRRAGPTASAHCRYLLATEARSVEQRFERERDEVGGEIVDTGQVQAGTVSFDWAHIEERGAWLNTFFGTAILPYGRQLDVKVHEGTGDAAFAKRVFNRVIESLSLTDSPLLEDGGELMRQVKDRGLDNLLDNRHRQSLFLIKDAIGEVHGFTADVLVDTGKSDQLNIEGAGVTYIRGPQDREHVTSFQSDNRFERFAWSSDRYVWDGRTIAAGRRGTRISLDEAGVLTIAKLTEQDEENSYHAGPLMLPEVLLEQLLCRMLDSDKNEIVLDVIEASGAITPTHISKAKTENNTSDEEPIHMVKLVPLNGEGFSQSIYLDEQKHVFKSIVRHKDAYIFESAEPEEAARLFPERAEYILQRDKLKPNRSVPK